jgi:hypothetical protein
MKKMDHKKNYLLGFTLLALLIHLLPMRWETVDPISNEIAWVLKQLPDVKAVEYLDSLKKS